MLQRGLFLFRLLGIPLYLDLSFLVVLPLLALLIAGNLPLYLRLFGLPQEEGLLQGPGPSSSASWPPRGSSSPFSSTSSATPSPPTATASPPGASPFGSWAGWRSWSGSPKNP